ncbi:MAG TPA: hypothetical protein DDW51_05485 [Cyanobacteria bacterium UBA11367]|nr:hypothetical protein [Cyanobacteria bacterium UBA11367]HBE56784.1 hypothetical protein [Cyanobacteria bacterium UBA11366]
MNLTVRQIIFGEAEEIGFNIWDEDSELDDDEIEFLIETLTPIAFKLLKKIKVAGVTPATFKEIDTLLSQLPSKVAIIFMLVSVPLPGAS